VCVCRRVVCRVVLFLLCVCVTCISSYKNRKNSTTNKNTKNSTHNRTDFLSSGPRFFWCLGKPPGESRFFITKNSTYNRTEWVF